MPLHRLAAIAICLSAAWGCGPSGKSPEPTAPILDASAQKSGSVIRVATFNAALNRAAAGGLVADLATGEDKQARAVAAIIQRVRPDILLLNEFDYDPDGRALALFQERYLSVGQEGAAPLVFTHAFTGPVNTGLASGRDLDGDGVIATTPGERNYGGDSFGYGAFPGQYGMAILSAHPIDRRGVRTFQKFLWKDMPGALLPDDPATPEPGDFYAPEARAILRLSSKSHWDAPILIGGKRLHLLASHPTPPVFDGAEDRNGKRNHDEIRLWADYITKGVGGYIVDDAGEHGGLEASERFIVLGDLNADPADGDGVRGAVAQLLSSPLIADPSPKSAGGDMSAAKQGGANHAHRSIAALDTADFFDGANGPGNLRLDYVLPSVYGVKIHNAGVFWPQPGDKERALVGEGDPVVSSDHRLVWVDIELTD